MAVAAAAWGAAASAAADPFAGAAGSAALLIRANPREENATRQMAQYGVNEASAHVNVSASKIESKDTRGKNKVCIEFQRVVDAFFEYRRTYHT